MLIRLALALALASDSRREVHGTIMPARVSDPEALERLLDYLESLR
jgi:hypothetical protein